MTNRLPPEVPASRPIAAPPPLVALADRAALLRLLADLAAAGVRIAARGDGRVHLAAATGSQPPELAARAAELRPALDALAAEVRWDNRGRPRVTLAAVLMAGLDALGVAVEARPDRTLGYSPGVPAGHRPLRDVLEGVRGEAWSRVAVQLPHPLPPPARCRPSAPRRSGYLPTAAGGPPRTRPAAGGSGGRQR